MKGRTAQSGSSLACRLYRHSSRCCIQCQYSYNICESASGVADGGRTGLTAVTVAGLFLLALFFAPLVSLIPSAATAPALVIVGIYMMEPVIKIDFTDFTEAIPAFLTIAMMPFAYSIAEGLVWEFSHTYSLSSLQDGPKKSALQCGYWKYCLSLDSLRNGKHKAEKTAVAG